MFEIEFTNEFGAWWGTLSEAQQRGVSKRVNALAQVGPAARRPLVGEIKGSAFDPRMKALRGPGNVRVLFIFDPRRTAILLVGGDKSGDFKGWYRKVVPVADQLYRVYLDELADEEGR